MADSSHQFPLEKSSNEAPPTARPMVGLAILGALALVLTLIGVDVAVISGTRSPPARAIIQRPIVRLASNASVAPVVYLSVSPGVKPGPDGKLHDAFSITSFYVHAGQPVKLVIDNTDNSPHSITSPSAGVNIVVRPGTHTYRLLVARTGVFQWFCDYPCDPYSMAHVGYMRGTITAI